MEESQSNGMHTDRPSDEEIQVPSGNGDGPVVEAEPDEVPEAEAPEASEPEAATPEPDAPVAEEAPAASDEPATEPEPVVGAVEEPVAEAATEPEPEVISEPPVVDVPAIEVPPEIVAEPVTEEPAAEEPAAEVQAAAAGEPSPELAAAVEEAFEGVEEEPIPEWIPGEWFVVHTYAGYENKVKTNLETRVHSMNMEDKIYEVVIPMEDVMEIKSGKKQVVQRKVFPGYLLVRMELDDDSWYVVRNTPGVTGFVGSGTKPIPLSEKEVDRILKRKGVEEKPKPKIEYSPGDGVRVVAGPFANFQGVISEIDMDRSKLKVLVNIFGRETPVELGFDQVAKL